MAKMKYETWNAKYAKHLLGYIDIRQAKNIFQIVTTYYIVP